jgi:hypothetical protein
MKENNDRLVLKEKVAGFVTNKIKANFAVEPQVWNHVVISFDGTNYQVVVDGTPIITMPATITPFGNAGFRMKNTGARFKQILVQ